MFYAYFFRFLRIIAATAIAAITTAAAVATKTFTSGDAVVGGGACVGATVGGADCEGDMVIGAVGEGTSGDAIAVVVVSTPTIVSALDS